MSAKEPGVHRPGEIFGIGRRLVELSARVPDEALRFLGTPHLRISQGLSRIGRSHR